MTARLENLEERLSTHGLARRRWRWKKSSAVERQAFARQLRVFGEQSGPAFVAFLRELGTRLDLLPLSDCATLAAAADRTPETPFARIAALIEETLGAPVEDLFGVFDHEPLRRSLFTQWHSAVTIDGDEVMVEVVRPDVTPELGAQLDQLHVLISLEMPDDDWARLDMASLIEDFRADLDDRLDLRAQRHALASLSSAIVDDDALSVAEPVDHLCSEHVLTVKKIEGRFVDSLDVADPTPPEPDPDADPEADERAPEPDDDVARQLCLAWLQQALFGECYPAHARPDDLVHCGDGRFAIVGGGLATLTLRSRNSLLDYLAAASRQDPDLAAVLLTREMTGHTEDRRETLRLLFRQAEPFRDGGWIPDYAGPRLAHDLFVQWRLATRSGFEQLPHLRSFCRGLAELERTTREMAPERDALQQGLDDVRVIGAAVNMRHLLGPTHLIGNLERLLPAGQELLHRLNEISLDVNQGRIHLVELPHEHHRETSAGGRFERLVALLMVMTAIALVTPRLASLVVGATWIEPAGVVLFLAIAVVLLWKSGRRGG